MKEEIRNDILRAGAHAVGFAEAGEIDAEFHARYLDWIEEGNNGEMEYLRRHIPLRQHTDNVLPGARTVISMAFSYKPKNWRPADAPAIAAYAYGEDYHLVIREKIGRLLRSFQERYGGKWRLCIDSAPVAERFWAMKAGLGYRGLNGSVIVEKCGSLCFLAEILSTLSMTPDNPSEGSCEKCGKCLDVCPGKAIRGDGTIDARKCINYLTIEKKSEFTEEEKAILSHGKGYIMGCDKCLRVCPHNHKNDIEEIGIIPMNPEIFSLNPERINRMGEEEFKKTFSRSPLGYAGYERINRNLRLL